MSMNILSVHIPLRHSCECAYRQFVRSHMSPCAWPRYWSRPKLGDGAHVGPAGAVLTARNAAGGAGAPGAVAAVGSGSGSAGSSGGAAAGRTLSSRGRGE